MTDGDKLELLGFIEDHYWALLGGARRNDGFEYSDERLQTIERCQRIRANLKGQRVPFPKGFSLNAQRELDDISLTEEAVPGRWEADVWTPE